MLVLAVVFVAVESAAGSISGMSADDGRSQGQALLALALLTGLASPALVALRQPRRPLSSAGLPERIA